MPQLIQLGFLILRNCEIVNICFVLLCFGVTYVAVITTVIFSDFFSALMPSLMRLVSRLFLAFKNSYTFFPSVTNWSDF